MEETDLRAPNTSSQQKPQQNSQIGTAVGSNEEKKLEINGGDQRGEKNRRECIARATSKEKASKESEEEGSETE